MTGKSHLSELSSSKGISSARRLRANLTDAERLLWSKLRSRQLAGWKFRRQVPLGPYIVDFLYEEARLVVELDGGQHADLVEQDAIRTAWLQGQGYKVVRFWNNELLANIEGVLLTLTPPSGPQRWPHRPKGEGVKGDT